MAYTYRNMMICIYTSYRLTETWNIFEWLHTYGGKFRRMAKTWEKVKYPVEFTFCIFAGKIKIWRSNGVFRGVFRMPSRMTSNWDSSVSNIFNYVRIMLCRLCIFPMPDSVSCLMHLLLIRLQNTSKLSKWLNFEILDRHVIPCDILPKVLCLQTAKTFITRDATKVDPRSNSYSYTAGWTEHLDFGLIWKQSECQLGCKCLLAPTNNQTKKNSDNAWLADAGAGVHWLHQVRDRVQCLVHAFKHLILHFRRWEWRTFHLGPYNWKAFPTFQSSWNERFHIMFISKYLKNEKQYNHRVKNDRSKNVKGFYGVVLSDFYWSLVMSLSACRC